MTREDQPKHKFCRDRNGNTIRAWATVLREQWDLPDTVSVSALHIGKMPKNGKLRVTWDEVQYRGDVEWSVRDGASGPRLGQGPTLRSALTDAVLAVVDPRRAADAEQVAFADGFAGELRRRAAASRAQAAQLLEQAAALEAAAKAFVSA